MNLLSLFILSTFWIFKSGSVPLGYFNGSDLAPANLASIVTQVKPGTVVIIGEKHYNKSAQKAQMEVLEALRDRGLIVSVGLEFISYPVQAILDSFCQGLITETEFIKQSDWGAAPFDGYRDLALFPFASEGGQARGINAPRQIASKIAKSGINSLTPDEGRLLPPQFELGRTSYRKRFLEIMSLHLPSTASADNYFAAQSVWDDTMAWQAAEFIATHSNQVFVIIVGDFHIQYGGGLADRLRTRGVSSILTLSQVDHSEYSVEELDMEIIPHPEYGPRADFLWIF